MIKRIIVTLEPEKYPNKVTILRVKVERLGEEDVHIQRAMNVSDFESKWDYEWNACKQLLDAELKKANKGQ